jgi:hypothetical protein
MVLARWQSTIVDEAGNIQDGASVTVQREIAGAPLATLFSDRDGAVPLGNPITADSEGFAAFHAVGGAYRITATKGGFSRVWRYVGIGRAQEFDLVDAEGLAVVQNVDAGYALFFEDEISAPPSAGSIRFNNANLSAATEAYVSVENAGGSDIEARLLELFDAARTVKDTFLLADPDSNTQASWQIDGAAADGSPASYVTLTISAHAGETSFTDGVAVNFQPNRAGADGDDGQDGADGEVPASRTLTADAGLTGGGDLSVNRSFAVGAGTGIVVNADDVAIDKATDADVRASVADKILSADHLNSAQALVALADAATVAVDWSTGINFSVALTANRALGNPTNVIAGQARTIVVVGNSGTERELSFGANYVGAATLTGITSSRRALISFYAETASRIWVSYRYQDDE